MKAMKFDGSTPTKILLSQVSQSLTFPCSLRIDPIPSPPDREGFTSWIGIQHEGEDAKTGEQSGSIIRVDARLIVLDVPAILTYGGGRNAGEFEIHLRRGAPPKYEHVLTQYLDAGDIGVPVKVPFGAEFVEITQGEATPILNRASFELWESSGPSRLSQHLGVGFQTRIGIGGADLLIMLTAPAVGSFFQVSWIIVL